MVVRKLSTTQIAIPMHYACDASLKTPNHENVIIETNMKFWEQGCIVGLIDSKSQISHSSRRQGTLMYRLEINLENLGAGYQNLKFSNFIKIPQPRDATGHSMPCAIQST